MTEEENIDDSKAPLVEHLTELRSRLIRAMIAIAIAFVFCFSFSDEIFNILTSPYVRARGDEASFFQFTALPELFFTQIKIGFFGALFLAFPVLASQIYSLWRLGFIATKDRRFTHF